ncbi:MAG: RNA 2',3'-cyclic phosphodiesterase [Solirubrobacteraceae bacterium]
MTAAGGEPSRGKARLFVALDLPNDIRQALEDWQRRELGALPELRAVAPEALHLTLCFLGWRDLADAGRIGELTLGAAKTVHDLALGEPTWLPRRVPRVLAIEVEDAGGRCSRLQGAVADALVTGGFYERETRLFLPHVTVGRVRRGRASRGLRDRVPSPAPLRFDGAAVTLYRSRPTTRRATYEPLARAVLA